MKNARDTRDLVAYYGPWLKPAERDEAARIISHPVLTRARAMRLARLCDIAEQRRGACPWLVVGCILAVATLLSAITYAAIRLSEHI